MKETNADSLASTRPATDDGRVLGPSRFFSRLTRLPPEARLLRSLSWLIAIRLVVITSVVLPYLLAQLASPTGLPTFDLLFLLAGLTYFASLVYIVLLRMLRARPVAHAFIQFTGDLLLVAQSNAGLPQVVGDHFEYDATAGDLAAHATRLAKLGIDLVGGCCGSTPSHIAAMGATLTPT